MTIVGQHTVGETRDLIRSTEFRVNKNMQQLQRVKSFRLRPPTAAQNAEWESLDKDMTTFLDRWTTVRDKETLAMTVKMLATGPGVPPSVVPAESSFVAITKTIQVDEPRLGFLQQRIDAEARSLGLPPVDLSGIPAQNTSDVDFAALRKLDAAIAEGELAAKEVDKKAKEVAKSNIGLMITGGVVLVLGGGVLAKVYL